MSRVDADDGVDERSRRKDGRRSLLVYMESDLIKELKKLAVDREVTVFSIVEDAVRDWVRRQEKRDG
jgi:predicted transcriptional regulator